MHRGDESFAREVAFEAAKLFASDDDNFVTPMHGDMLRPIASYPAHQFAEARLCILQSPVTGMRIAHPAARLLAQW